MKKISDTGPCQNPDCDGEYKLYKTTDPKYCSPACLYKCKPPPEKKPQAPIPRRSKKRAAQEAVYNQLVKAFLAKPENQICPVTKKKSVEVHHKKGREGILLLAVEFWMAVSREGHNQIHDNPEWAYEKGYMLSRLARDD